MKTPKSEGRAQRDSGMASPTAPRNTTVPRKTRDMPESEGYKKRDPEKDYTQPPARDC